MGDYATKHTDDDGDYWLASDGKRYATRSGAWKWSKKVDAPKKEVKPEPEIVDAPEPEPQPTEPSGPEWMTFDYESEDGPTEVMPALLKRIKPVDGKKRTKKQIEAETQTSIAVLGVAYRTSDHLLTTYKRAVLRDKEAEPITHSDEDIEWISGVTNDGLVHSGVHIAGLLSPVHLAVACNTYWFGRPLVEIQSKKKGSLGVGSLMERIPFLGSRLKSRRLAKEAEAYEQELVERPLQA